MDSINWKHGWRLWSPRSYTEAIDTRTGDKVVMRLTQRGLGVAYDRFGPNVGQPIPRPPIHPLHHDIPALQSGLKLGCWTLDGCYELELVRPEAHLKLILSDSRSLACGPSDDPIMRQGVLLAQIECLHLNDNVELTFEPQANSGLPLHKIILGGPAFIQNERIYLSEGVHLFVVGHMPEKINQAKALKRIRQMVSYVRHYGTAQESGPQRMGHAVRWNICFDMTHKDIFLPPTRSWVEMMSSILNLPDAQRRQFILTEDAILSALLVARSEAPLARAIIKSILANQQPDGRLPPLIAGPHASDRTVAPLLSLAAWYLCYDGNMEFVSQIFSELVRAHRWIMENRQPRGDGLLAWGDDREFTKSSPIRIDGWVGAAYESGMNNSPMWDDLGFDFDKRSLGRACIDLCSLTALSARILATIAERLGIDPSPFKNDFRSIHEAVNRHLWGADEIYHNQRNDGSLSAHISPTSFFPLAAGIVPKDRVNPLLHRHLKNRETFWGYPGIPSMPRNSPFFDGDGDYWRGRIWPSMNYWIWAGLRQHAPLEAAQLAEVSRDLFEGEWEKEKHVHENYSALTGNGEAKSGTYARSAPLYCCGGLLLLPDLEEKIGGAIARLPEI